MTDTIDADDTAATRQPLDIDPDGHVAESTDSALQWVCFDLRDAGLDADAQQAALDSVRDQFQDLKHEILPAAVSRAFRDDPEAAATWVTQEFATRLEYADVPDEWQDDVQDLVECRLEQSITQLTELLEEEIVEHAEQRAVRLSAGTLWNWGTVE